MDQKSKYWCFTLNNYSDLEYGQIAAIFSDESKEVNYLIVGKEVGETGTAHLQGYIEFSTRIRLPAVKERVCQRAHFERRRGSPTEAADYCKKDKDFIEYGTLSRGKGARVDLDAIRVAISEGAEEKEISDQYFPTWCVYRRSFDRYRELCNEPRFRSELKVYVLWGDAGVGKTRFATEYARRRGKRFWISSVPDLQWFDGYAQQEVVILDDYRGDAPIALLLRLLDIYELRVPVKGGFVAWNPAEIWLTSNKEPGEWHPSVDFHPLRRRLTRIVYFSGKGTDWETEFVRIAINLGVDLPAL